MQEYDIFGHKYPSITTPEAFIENNGSPDLDCWSRDIESLRQHVFHNSGNNGMTKMNWNESLYFAKKVAEIWKRDREKIVEERR